MLRHDCPRAKSVHQWPGNLGSILDPVISKTQKIVLDTAHLNTQNSNVFIKGQVEQSTKKSSALPYISVS